MKRLLMIAYHFPPFAGSSGVQRTLRFVQQLPQFGWHPTVLTVHPRGYAQTSPDLVAEIPPGVDVHRAFVVDTARHLSIGGRYAAFLARPDRWRTWWLGAVPVGLGLIRRLKPDALWSTYPIATAHAIGATLNRLTGVPWIASEGSVYSGLRPFGTLVENTAYAWERAILTHIDTLSERRLLARMAHPGIARILDGGTTSNGLHYLVMELVNGRPLDQYVNMVGPALPARVALVRDVCDAVAHAHQNLVLHCDLKPANILVTATGDTRLIDFGVARGQDMDDARREGFTQGYSSPQRLAGLPAVTADDVYALGVVLRSVAPEGPLDLQAIIRRATAQAREDRYASADALRDDLKQLG